MNKNTVNYEFSFGQTQLLECDRISDIMRKAYGDWEGGFGRAGDCRIGTQTAKPRSAHLREWQSEYIAREGDEISGMDEGAWMEDWDEDSTEVMNVGGIRTM